MKCSETNLIFLYFLHKPISLEVFLVVTLGLEKDSVLIGKGQGSPIVTFRSLYMVLEFYQGKVGRVKD